MIARVRKSSAISRFPETWKRAKVLLSSLFNRLWQKSSFSQKGAALSGASAKAVQYIDISIDIFIDIGIDIGINICICICIDINISIDIGIDISIDIIIDSSIDIGIDIGIDIDIGNDIDII
jgi:hypothetical protein